MPVRRRPILLLALVVLAMLLPSAAAARPFPDTIRLPDGFQPEGIASGRGTSLFVGSIPTGAIWAGDARTGNGAVLVPPHRGRNAIGIKVDRRDRIFVAGGPTGQAYVYDARTGGDLASYQLAAAGRPTFVNDVVVTRKGAFFTDSLNQQLYVIPLGRHGRLPGQAAVRTLPLTGELVFEAGFNLNGIAAAKGGRVLVVVQSNTGKLFTVNPRTGRTREIHLGGATVTNGDGLLLRGRILFVVRNRLNLIAVVKLSRSLSSGRVLAELTDPDFDVPTTLAVTAGHLYTVNARFGVTDPQARYHIVRVDD
jgi:outer membrane protein assembly factor BamB